MNSKDFNTVVEAQLKRCTDILCKKAEEYADAEHDERLHNFKSVAGFTGQNPKTVLFGMWAKHLASVKDMCLSGEHYLIELWNEKITDTINYALLLEAMVCEEEAMKNPFEPKEVSFSVNMKPEDMENFMKQACAFSVDPTYIPGTCMNKPDPHDPWDLRDPDAFKEDPNDIPQNPFTCG